MESTKTEQNAQVQEKTFPAVVATVIDNTKLAINRGSLHGLRVGQRMVVYSLGSEEIIDPISGESLGVLEIFKGTGEIIHLQEKLATLESDRQKGYRRSANVLGLGLMEYEAEKAPFNNPEVGDRVKPI